MDMITRGATRWRMARIQRRRRTHIKAWRKYRNLTQEQLAERLETTGATISRVETGKTPYDQGMIEALADALQCEPADLLARPPDSDFGIAAVLGDMTDEQKRKGLALLRALISAEKAA
jgi:transcriptional regulator with XRE-family HTH domain